MFCTFVTAEELTIPDQFFLCDGDSDYTESISCLRKRVLNMSKKTSNCFVCVSFHLLSSPALNKKGGLLYFHREVSFYDASSGPSM